MEKATLTIIKTGDCYETVLAYDPPSTPKEHLLLASAARGALWTAMEHIRSQKKAGSIAATPPPTEENPMSELNDTTTPPAAMQPAPVSADIESAICRLRELSHELSPDSYRVLSLAAGMLLDASARARNMEQTFAVPTDEEERP